MTALRLSLILVAAFVGGLFLGHAIETCEAQKVGTVRAVYDEAEYDPGRTIDYTTTMRPKPWYGPPYCGITVPQEWAEDPPMLWFAESGWLGVVLRDGAAVDTVWIKAEEVQWTRPR
jgi:hypothetical protein